MTDPGQRRPAPERRGGRERHVRCHLARSLSGIRIVAFAMIHATTRAK
ncbi:hypothetical protein ACF1AE_20460 [Streptomyces sp. NPDC014986]